MKKEKKNKVDKTKTTFRCPICKRNIEIGEWGKSSWPDEPQGTGSSRYTKENFSKDPQSLRNMEYRLSNKRYHMRMHKKYRRKKEIRTARRQAAVDRL